ncbi:hypothetical protein SAMN05421595_1563 [Austwickia chelonae]|uniref:Uncharacterized protein n=1 Tax=Austwickia chelonae NBRC 105200 TaxID=1184607 RepID=K6VQT1_9MICO|nr:hypothetical protein [Austwickia chelonae]GAB77725.1 hypothetical protein AUCHE_05_06400 [Austwickia chelonae NBRC 105200]SEW16616.1 hypothetical protein SAMN05421595_1563 [Austwickia chelonae]
MGNRDVFDDEGRAPTPYPSPHPKCQAAGENDRPECNGTLDQLMELEITDFDNAIELGTRLHHDLRRQLQEAAEG